MNEETIQSDQCRDQSPKQVLCMFEHDIPTREVIRLGPEQIHECLELDRLALNGLWSKKQWQQELFDSRRLCMGLLRSSKLLALASGWLVVDELHLTAIAVHPQHRRQGHARLVLSRLLQEAHLAGAAQATLEVSSTNSAARELYKSCGFKTAGCRHHYYSDGQDALIQWRSLNDKNTQRKTI